MLQLILHGIGDYLIQTDTWAVNKKNKGIYGFLCCLKHCITYTIPFVFITQSPLALTAIFISHFVVDRTRIVEWSLAWKNGVRNISNFGFSERKPTYIAFWLFIITDNVIHLLCNYLAIEYL